MGLAPCRPILVVLLGGAFAVGCHALLDIDDVEFGAGTTPGGAPSGATSSGGSGGAAGQTAGGSGGGSAAGAGGAGGGGGQGGAVLGPWGPAQVVAAIADSAADDDDPTFTADLLELYFNSDRPDYGDSDIFVSVRTSTAQPWGPPSAVAELNTNSGETNPVVAQDGLSIWLGSNRISPRGIFVSTRASRSAAWSTPVEETDLNSASDDIPCAVTADGLTIVIESRRDGTWDLFQSTRSSTTAAWSTPAPITELNTEHSDLEVWLSADGLTAYYDTDHPGGTQADLYRTTRPSLSSPFETTVPVYDLNTSDSESDPWVSPDERYIMFTRGPAPRTIYEAFR